MTALVAAVVIIGLTWYHLVPGSFGGQGGPGLALVVGVGSGLGAVAFRYLIYFFTWLATGHAARGRTFAGHLPAHAARLVLSPDGERIEGWLSAADVLRAIAARTGPSGAAGPRTLACRDG